MQRDACRILLFSLSGGHSPTSGAVSLVTVSKSKSHGHGQHEHDSDCKQASSGDSDYAEHREIYSALLLGTRLKSNKGKVDRKPFPGELMASMEP